MKSIKMMMAAACMVAMAGVRLNAQNTADMREGVVVDDRIVMKWSAEAMEDKAFSFRGTEQATYRIAWGDGDTVRVTGMGLDSTLRMSHRYKEAGSYTVSLYGERDFNYSYNYTETALGIDLKMVYVGGATFMMGCTAESGSSCNNDERPAHRVTLSSYGIGMYEVTQGQWEKVMGTTIHQQRDKADPLASLYGVGADYPMYYVNWEEARAFCAKLSEASGRLYSLPTEAEWEYAARGGIRNGGHIYSGSNTVSDVAWYSGSVVSHVGGEKNANELGIYDMSGNVNEWCLDWYGTYPEEPQENPSGLSSGTKRVFRGGGFNTASDYARVSARNSAAPETRNRDLGFRVVCIP